MQSSRTSSGMESIVPPSFSRKYTWADESWPWNRKWLENETSGEIENADLPCLHGTRRHFPSRTWWDSHFHACPCQRKRSTKGLLLCSRTPSEFRSWVRPCRGWEAGIIRHQNTEGSNFQLRKKTLFLEISSQQKAPTQYDPSHQTYFVTIDSHPPSLAITPSTLRLTFYPSFALIHFSS